MRHNTDTTFLPTNSAGLSMVYYATNYSTKLDTPLWKRAAMVKTVMETMGEQEGQQEPPAETTSEQTAQKNNKARQFLGRAANRIFTSREVSAVEVCSSLLGYKNSYSSQGSWSHVHLNTLYWAVFRRWDSLREAAGPDIQLRAAPEVVGISLNGFTSQPLRLIPTVGGSCGNCVSMNTSLWLAYGGYARGPRYRRQNTSLLSRHCPTAKVGRKRSSRMRTRPCPSSPGTWTMTCKAQNQGSI
jgi:hypothetical protein